MTEQQFLASSEVADLLPIAIGLSAVILARVATVYLLLATSKVDNAPVPSSWKNVGTSRWDEGSAFNRPGGVSSSKHALQRSDQLNGGRCVSLDYSPEGFLLSHYTARRFPRKPSVGIQTVLSATR